MKQETEEAPSQTQEECVCVCVRERNITKILNVFLVSPRFSAFADETGPKHWNNLRYEHVMKLRQAALETAREIWADYLLVCSHPMLSFAVLLILHFCV